ncbi:MAG: coiled-coil domain-containing protein, partial [Actinomycetales bacterium]
MRRGVVRVVTGVTLAAFLWPGFGAPPVAALPSRDLDQVRNQVLDLEMQAGAAHERAEQAKLRLRDVQGDLKVMQDRLKRKRQAVREVRQTLDGIARSIYISGSIDPTLQLLLADDPAEFLSLGAVVQLLAKSQLDVLRGYRTKQLQLAQAEAAVADRRKAASDRRAEMVAAEAQVKERLAAAEKVLSGLQTKERQRLWEIERRRRQQQAAEARRQVKQVGASNVSSARVRSVIKYA